MHTRTVESELRYKELEALRNSCNIFYGGPSRHYVVSTDEIIRYKEIIDEYKAVLNGLLSFMDCPEGADYEPEVRVFLPINKLYSKPSKSVELPEYKEPVKYIAPKKEEPPPPW